MPKSKPAKTKNPPMIIHVSVSEAARLFGVSTRTVRRAIADDHVVYVVVQGRYKISFESLIQWSQCRPHVRNKLACRGIGQFVDQWRISNALLRDGSAPASSPIVESTGGDVSVDIDMEIGIDIVDDKDSSLSSRVKAAA